MPKKYIYVFHVFLRINSDYFFNGVNRLIFVMFMGCVLFEVRPTVLNVTYSVELEGWQCHGV
jgi:hypothetical protein